MVINVYLILYKGVPYFNYISLFLTLVFIAFVRLDTYLLIIVFLTPLSIPLRELFSGLDYDMWLPTEPLLVGLLLIFLLKWIKGEKLDSKLLRHPVSIAIFFSLFWIFFTSISSTMFVVSIKFFFSRIWFVIPFYFVAAQMFKNKENMKKYLWCYLLALLIVISYTLSRHASFGFMDENAAHSVMNPFYTDHTSYGAILAMMIPVTAGFIFNNSFRPVVRMAAALILGILAVAMVFSYTRAAWLSLMIAGIILVVLILRIRFSILLIIGIIGIIFVINKADLIALKIEENRNRSTSELSKHLSSMSDVSTDASNLERINRWSCAVRMFMEKPLLGWGPGTYMFQYAPFQVTREKTRISTNAANRGNAHSEYLGPLAESGLFGLLSFLLIVIFTLYTGVKTFANATDRNDRILVTSVFLGLITYYIHGFLNNFLDMDKASALFWGFTALIVAMDISQRSKSKSNEALKNSEKFDTQD